MYLKFMMSPTETIEHGQRDDEQWATVDVPREDACRQNVKNCVRKWYERLWDVRDGGADETFPAVDEMVRMFDPSAEKPLYDSMTAGVREILPVECQVLAAAGRRRWILEEERRGIAAKDTTAVDGRRRANDRNLLTFRSVWHGLVHLNSTRAFCAFLNDHPELAKPPFLVSTGLFGSEDTYQKFIETWKRMISEI